MNSGILFVVSAPSGAGKTTLVQHLARKDRGLVKTVSHTTRIPRPDEKEGRDYYFVGRKHFEEMIKKRDFVEWAKVYGEFYGTSKKTIQQSLRSGKDVILVIESKGGKAIHKHYPQAVRILILPPSIATLRKRLKNRGGSIALRLKKAKADAKSMAGYDYLVVNDRLADAINELKCVVTAERQRLSRRKAIFRKFIR